MATDPVADVVTACRALAARGCDTGIGGHVSIQPRLGVPRWHLRPTPRRECDRAHARFLGDGLASLARPMKMRHNLCTLFYQDQVMSPDDSFESIGPALGDASTIIIPWHGAITVGSSIARAAALHVTLEDMAKLDASGDTAATAISAHPYPANLSGSPSTT